MSNIVVFLIKTVVLFLVFWLISAIINKTDNPLPNWASWLILAGVASALDYVVDIVLKPGSRLASYTKYSPRNNMA